MKREMWAKRTLDSPWEHFVLIGETYFLNGIECEPFDFQKIHDEAHLVDSVFQALK